MHHYHSYTERVAPTPIFPLSETEAESGSPMVLCGTLTEEGLCSELGAHFKSQCFSQIPTIESKCDEFDNSK